MKLDINKIGVYKIIFPNNEFYFGSAYSKQGGISGRWEKHKQGHHSSPKYLQDLANNYNGWNNPEIRFIILYNTDTKKDALTLEAECISKYWTDDFKDPLLLNRNRFVIRQPDISGNNNPMKRAENRKKISESKMGNKNPMKRPEVRKKVSESKKGQN